MLLHKIEEANDDAATSLIELSQSQEDAGTVDTVVEISGDQAWLPDGYSRIFKFVCVWPFGLLDYGYATKFDPFLSLDRARVEGVRAQSKERMGSNFAA